MNKGERRKPYVCLNEYHREYILQNWETKTNHEMADLIGCTDAAISLFLLKHGIKNPTRWQKPYYRKLLADSMGMKRKHAAELIGISPKALSSARLKFKHGTL